MGIFRKKEINRADNNIYVGAGKKAQSYSLYLQAQQLIERSLAFVSFSKKNPNPFESMNEFIIHLVNSYKINSGVTVVKSGTFYYVADSLAEQANDTYLFSSNVVLGTNKSLSDFVSKSNVTSVSSATLSSMVRVQNEANQLLGTATQTVKRRLNNLGVMNLIWQKKGLQDLKVMKDKNTQDVQLLSEMASSSGGVLTAGLEDKFTQLQPDYSKADGTEISGAVALYSYVTGISPEYMRGAQSDQQLVNTVLELLKPFLTTLAEKIPYFKFTFDFTQLATLQQSQAKTTGDSNKLTPQALGGQAPLKGNSQEQS